MKFLAAIVKCLMRLLSLLPLKVHYALASVLGFLLEKVFRYRVQDATINIARSFPDIDYKEVKAIRHRFYRHLADIAAEAVWFGGCKGGRRLHESRIVRIDGLTELARCHESSPDIVVLMSHTGNWELYGGYASYVYTEEPMPFNDGNVCIVYLRQSSKVWDQVMRSNRLAPIEEGFEGYLESRQVIRYALEHRGQKKIYNFITDQYPYFGSTLPVRFMNQDTLSMKGAADLARKTGAAVFYLGMTSEGRGHYTLRYKPICDNASEMSSAQIMEQYYSLLEADIRAQPWNWLWTHRRWKQPDNTQ